VSLVTTILGDQVDQLATMTQEARRRAVRLLRQELARLRKRVYGLQLDRWDSTAQAQLLREVQRSLAVLESGQLAVLVQLSQRAWVRGARGVASALTQLDRALLGTTPALRWDVVDWYASQATAYSQVRITTIERSLRRYGQAAADQVASEIAGAAVVGDSWAAARPRVWAAVRGTVGGRQWMVDRIVATEMSAAYNGARLEAMIAEDAYTVRPADRVQKRLVATFDGRTGQDSYLQAGQTVPVRAPFIDVKSGRPYQAPPNRPHDREIVVPWRASYTVTFPDYDREVHTDERGQDTAAARAGALRDELARLRKKRAGLVCVQETDDPSVASLVRDQLAMVDAQIAAGEAQLRALSRP
jgi:hypothetical protein